MAVASYSPLVLRWSRLVVPLVLGLGLGFGLGLAAAAGGFVVFVISGLYRQGGPCTRGWAASQSKYKYKL